MQEMFRRHLGNLAKLVQQLRGSSMRRGSVARYYMHDQATRQLQLATNLLPVLAELGDPDGQSHVEALDHFRIELGRLCPTRS